MQLRQSRCPRCSRSSASSARSTRASRASRTRRACATSRTSRWRARTTRRRFASTRTTRRRSTRRSSRPRSSTGTRSTSRSEYWLDALFEESWAYFMAGDYRARARQHPHDRVAVLPELVLPRGRHPQGRHLLRQLPVRRRDDDRRAVPDRSTSRSTTSSSKVLDALQGRGPGGAVLQVPEGRARRQGGPPADASSPSSRTRSRDRQLLRNLEYVRVLDEEDEALQEGAGELPGLAARRRRQGRAARSRATSPSATPGTLARERYQRNLDELNEHLRDGAKILIDITAAQRNQLDQAIAGAPGHGRGVEGATSSSPTRSTSSGRSTASTGATSSASTARPSPRSAGGK